LAVLGTTSVACSAYIDSGREQCKKNEDCAALGKDYANWVCQNSLCKVPVDQTWACLDQPTGEPASGSVRVAFTLVDLLSEKPLQGVSLSLCAKLDAACLLPIAGPYVSNTGGQIEVEMPAGFDGYFQAELTGTIYPTLIFPPSTRKQRTPSKIPLVPNAFYPTMIRGVGTQVAADRSVVLITALDCLGRPAPGLTLSTSPALDDQSVAYLLAGGMPSRSAQVTDESGGGGFANIPAGGVVINSSLNGRLVGTAGVQTRPGFVSMVVIMPNGS
jgi:hypothetical protein